VPIVITSYWPPLVAMSVVTRSRSTFSSSVTQSSWMSGFFGEIVRQLLHADHIAIVDRGDGDGFGVCGERKRAGSSTGPGVSVRSFIKFLP
jgi:hypothetical protein